MRIPLHIAEKLLSLSNGEKLPGSTARHAVIEELVTEGILERRGRIQKTLYLHDPNALFTYLQNRHAIDNLPQYIKALKAKNPTRGKLVAAASDTKLKRVRSFKGFLINSYMNIEATMNARPFVINPVDGLFQFVYDFEHFNIPTDITVVGIENPENFRYINKQKQLFTGITPLFVSRYPQNQSGDLMNWLKRVDNPYLHFGDFDFAGIGIYLNEYKKHLDERATFFVPDNIEALISRYGNRKLYDIQQAPASDKLLSEPGLIRLTTLIHKHRKGLEQEAMIALQQYEHYKP